MGPLVLVQTDQLNMEAFGLAFRLHIWNRVNCSLGLLYTLYKSNVSNYNHNNWRD